MEGERPGPRQRLSRTNQPCRASRSTCCRIEVFAKPTALTISAIVIGPRRVSSTTISRRRNPGCNRPYKAYVQVGEEAPTVKGFISILVKAFDGSPLDEAARAQSDLLNQSWLSELIRMTRTVGLSAILGRIKRESARAAGTVATVRSPASAHALSE